MWLSGILASVMGMMSRWRLGKAISFSLSLSIPYPFSSSCNILHMVFIFFSMIQYMMLCERDVVSSNA